MRRCWLTVYLPFLLSYLSVSLPYSVAAPEPHVLRILRGLGTVHSLAVDRAGDVYAADDSFIVKFSGKTGEQLHDYYPTDISSTDPHPFQPYGTALFPNGDVLTCDPQPLRDRCVRLNSNNTVMANWTTSGPALEGHDAAVFSNGDVLVSEWQRLLRLDSQSRIVHVYHIEGLYWPEAVAVDGNDNVYVINAGWQVMVLDQHGNLSRVYNYSDYTVYSSLAVAKTGAVFIANEYGVSKLAVNGSAAQRLYTREASGLAVDDSGDVYTSITWRSNTSTLWETSILKLDSKGREVRRFTTTAPGLSQPRGLAVDGDGNTYVMNGQVLMLAPNGTLLFVYSPFANSPYSAAAVDKHGTVYIAIVSAQKYNYTLQLLQFAPYNNSPILFYAKNVVPANWNYISLTLDAAANVYVGLSDLGAVSVYKISPAGKLLQAFSTPLVTYPSAVAVDADQQYVYIADGINNVTVKLNTDNRLVQQYNVSANGLVVAKSGNVYVSQGYARSCIVKLSAAGAVLGTFNAAAPPLNYASGLALDGDENVLVADTGLNRVVVFASTEKAARSQLLKPDTAAQSKDVVQQ